MHVPAREPSLHCKGETPLKIGIFRIKSQQDLPHSYSFLRLLNKPETSDNNLTNAAYIQHSGSGGGHWVIFAILDLFEFKLWVLKFNTSRCQKYFSFYKQWIFHDISSSVKLVYLAENSKIVKNYKGKHKLQPRRCTKKYICLRTDSFENLIWWVLISNKEHIRKFWKSPLRQVYFFSRFQNLVHYPQLTTVNTKETWNAPLIPKNSLNECSKPNMPMSPSTPFWDHCGWVFIMFRQGSFLNGEVGFDLVYCQS